ncbi:MAG: hypothetical protein II689_05090, partial [Firmicutes bacterium]|nr:hypothetical protein [Bacillota bacterium]
VEEVPAEEPVAEEPEQAAEPEKPETVEPAEPAAPAGPIGIPADAQSEAPKKSRKPLYIAIALVAILAIAAAVVFGSGLFASPDKLYHKAELKAFEDVSDGLASSYGSFVEGVSESEVQLSGNAELAFDESLFDLLEMGGILDEDLSWLKAIRAEYTVNAAKEGRSGADFKLKLNGKDIATVNGVVDPDDELVYIKVPELSDEYAEIDLEDILDELYYELPYSVYSIIAQGEDEETKELITDVLKALPSESEFKKLLNKYVKLAVESIEGVEKGKDSLYAGSVSANYTALTVKIDTENAQRLAKNVLTEMEKDAELKKLIISIADAAGEDGEDTYESFHDRIADALDSVEDIELSKSETVTMTVYVDRKGNIAGREIKASGLRVTMAMPRDGSKVGIRLAVKTDGSYLIDLEGDGKISGSKLEAELTLKVYGIELAEVTVNEMELAKLKKGQIGASITIKPSKALLEELDLTGVAGSFAKKLRLTLLLDTSDKAASVSVSLQTDSSDLVKLWIDCKKSSGKKVGAASGVDVYDWLDSIDAKGAKEVIKRLKDAGVPADLLEELEDFVDWYL